MKGEPLILELKSIALGYGKMTVIGDLSLSMNCGELVVVIGANGAGKTTLLLGIAGLLPKQRGVVNFSGQNVTRTATHRLARQGLALVPEGRQVFGAMTVLDNLRLGGFRVGRALLRQRVAEIFDQFPILAERQNGLAGLLSGGEQQMLAMARAMMATPRLLLLDEPSMGLAPKMVEQIFAMIARLRASGISILLVEQNARMALELADRGLVLETGRIIKTGTGRELAGDSSIAEFYLGKNG
ncbi:MAG: ABC transporter ATP-binding protein [Candidatus Pacebacteria bacterium]|nr:ABC transporter ATP-binding protein [Candidatus Paceibacterota bacterium]